MTRKGYTFVEMMVVVLIMGVLATVAIPRLQFSAIRHKQAHGVARKLMADLRRTRTMALRDAATNSRGFELELTIDSPFTGYTITDKGSDHTVDTGSFDSNVCVTSNKDRYKYGPLGNLTNGEGGEIVISSEGQSYTISFVSATGAVILTEG